MLAQEVPVATAARLVGLDTSEPGALSATTVRQLVRERGAGIRGLEHGVARSLLWAGTRDRRVPGGCMARQRRRMGWPAQLSATVERAVRTEQERHPEGVSWNDWAWMRGAWAAEADLSLDLSWPTNLAALEASLADA